MGVISTCVLHEGRKLKIYHVYRLQIVYYTRGRKWKYATGTIANRKWNVAGFFSFISRENRNCNAPDSVQVLHNARNEECRVVTVDKGGHGTWKKPSSVVTCVHGWRLEEFISNRDILSKMRYQNVMEAVSDCQEWQKEECISSRHCGQKEVMGHDSSLLQLSHAYMFEGWRNSSLCAIVQN